jgi:hypothetical protein
MYITDKVDQVFVQGLETFDRLRIYGNAYVVLQSPSYILTRLLTSRIKDDTVPYPSAAIDTVDHFAEWSEHGIEVTSDSDGIMETWRRNSNPESRSQVVKRSWGRKLGTLPPVLKYRYPYNYVS